MHISIKMGGGLDISISNQEIALEKLMKWDLKVLEENLQNKNYESIEDLFLKPESTLNALRSYENENIEKYQSKINEFKKTYLK